MLPRNRIFLALTLQALLISSSTGVLSAQHIGESSISLMSPEYQAEAARLRSAPPQKYDFSKATLSDVLRFLATDAGISFFSLSDDSPDGGKLITFSIEASPFRVLETLCKANGLAIIPDNSIWYIRPADDRELIGQSYTVRHNALEMVDSKSAGGGLTGSPGGGGSGGGGRGSAGASLQGVGKTFTVQRSQLINHIRSLLGLGPEESDGAQMMQGLGAGAGGMGDDTARMMNSNQLSATRQPKVIWQSDSNTLYIVATRLQHAWIEGYLNAADKPQSSSPSKSNSSKPHVIRNVNLAWTGQAPSKPETFARSKTSHPRPTRMV